MMGELTVSPFSRAKLPEGRFWIRMTAEENEDLIFGNSRRVSTETLLNLSAVSIC